MHQLWKLSMCNRYVSPAAAEIERTWHLKSGGQPWAQAEVYPRALGPFVRQAADGQGAEMVLGQWGLIPWFAKTAKLAYSTNNARFEEITQKASYKQPWSRGQRCIIPAWSFDEPCWETGRNVWWRFARADGQPWGLAGLWSRWTDPQTGELIDSYTMLTLNADAHPLMSRMHKPDPKLAADQQDKRSVVVLEPEAWAPWLQATVPVASSLVGLAPAEVFEAKPLGAVDSLF